MGWSCLKGQTSISLIITIELQSSSMELTSLQSPSVTTTPSSLPRFSFIEKSSIYGQTLKFSKLKRYPDATNLKLIDFRPQFSGATKFGSELTEGSSEAADSKDEDLVYVAGATGKVGSRTVRELLKLGFRVRAGVRSKQRAETLVQSVKQLKLDVEAASEKTQPVEKLEIVVCDLEKPEQIIPALGNASVVICCIGASEKEISDISGPYRIDYQASKNLIDAATVAKVNHFILLTSLGTNKVGFPAAILNLFWGVLIWKRKAEEALLASGLPYTIVRPGGMERPTDTYKLTHNLTLSVEDTLFGGQVSNLQVAELLAFIAKKRNLSYCKVLEVIAETTAPLTPMEDLLAKIPSQRKDVSPKDSSGARVPDPVPSKSVVSEAPSTLVEKEPVEAKEPKITPLSPYIAYEDLKPPTSPTPTPSTTSSATKISKPTAPESIEIESSEPPIVVIEKEAIQMEVKKPRPQSPYTAYEDLKPPTSPRPTLSGPKEVFSSSSTMAEVQSTPIEGNDVAKATVIGVVEEDSPLSLSYHQSPYHAYDDLKPPTSPSPSQPNGPPLSTSSRESSPLVDTKSGSSTDQPPAANEPDEKQHHVQPKQRPLSPYTMYEELKPPSSPIPLPRKY